MADTITLRERIDELIAKHGTLRATARVLMTDCGYLHRLRSGEKTEPGDAVLMRMGLREVTRYERATTYLRQAGEWDEAQRILDLPEVDEAVLNFKDDSTRDNATCIVRAVMRACGAAGIDGPRHGPAADGSQTPNDAAAIPCAKAGNNAEALRGLRNLKVLLGADSPEVRGWAPAVQQAAQRSVNAAISALAPHGGTA